MLMSTTKLLVLRCFNMTLGRVDWFATKLKDILVKKMVLNSRNSYGATSRFYDPADLLRVETEAGG